MSLTSKSTLILFELLTVANDVVNKEWLSVLAFPTIMLIKLRIREDYALFNLEDIRNPVAYATFQLTLF
jgi:hypothetical protein